MSEADEVDEQPFAGCRIVDALGGLIGGYCAKLLVDAGAGATLLETESGDPLRRWRIGADAASDDPDPENDDGPLFRFLRAGQRARLATSDADVAAWGASADVVIVGLDGPAPDDLLTTNPSLVVVSITPYGRTGPWADRAATDFTLQADAGGLTIRGRPGTTPYHAGGRTGDWLSAAMAATAAGAALRAARQTGVGRVIDVSRAECATLAMTNYASIQAELRGPKGLKGPASFLETPAIEPTADGYVVFTTNTRAQLDSFCLLLGQPDLAEQYATAFARQGDWERWNRTVHAYTEARSTEEILTAASELRIPVAPVQNGLTAPTLGHFVARGVYGRDPSDRFTMPRRPWHVAGSPDPPTRSAPGPAIAAEPEARAREPGPGPDAEPTLPLAGITVVDCTAWWAGPMATWLLAALGADVIHVEATTRPDGMRLVGGAFVDQPQWWDRSWFFLGVNSNKRSLTLDLTTEPGVEAFDRLVASADVVVENYTPRVFDQFGLTWERLSSVNPRLIFARMPAFGLDGPWRDRPGFAQTMESLSGLAWVTGHPDDQPRLQGGPCDPNAGIHAAFAVIAALAGRDGDGKGRLLEVPMVESALNVAAEQVVEHSSGGALMERMGNRGPYAAPQGLYRAEDDWVAVAVADDDEWRALCAVVGESLEPEADAAQRRRDHDAIDTVVAAWVARRSAADAAGRLLDAGVAAAAARDPRRTTEHPQYAHRVYYERPDHPVVGSPAVPGLPLRMTGVDGWVRTAAPTLGAHNGEILTELGYTAADIAELDGAGVIGTTIG